MVGRLIARSEIAAGVARVGATVACGLWLLAAAPLLPGSEAAAQQDTVRVDTLAADTLTARERALRRLRAMPVTPVQRDTVLPDSLAADTLSDDVVLVAPTPDRPTVDTLAPGAPGDTTERQIFVVDSLPMPDEPLDADSVVALLRSLPGYDITDYQAEAAVFEAQTDSLRLTGESRVGRASRALRADSLLVFSGGAGTVCGYGSPVLEGEQEPITSEFVCYDIDRELGMARGARTRLTSGATWYVQGTENRVYLMTAGENNELYGEDTDFTSCDLPEPHYVFSARKVKIREDDVMIARDVTLRFGDVPVFWLPWMVQSMKRDRQSGLLMPQFGANDIVRNQSGYNRHISNLGFYWAINDYMSARATYEWFSNNWTAVTSALSYRWLRQFLDGGVTFTRYWRESGRTDMTIATGNNWQPDERTRLTLSGNYATSSDFVKRNSFSPRELNRNLAIGGGLTRSFDWGNINASARRQQQLSTDRITTELPSLSLTLSPITLYTSPDATNQLTWSGSGDVRRTTIEVPDTLLGVTNRDSERRNASFSHRLGFGRFSISQSAAYADDLDGFKPELRDAEGAVVDTALAERRVERLRWQTQASYQQSLWTGTSVTPSISLAGGSLRDERTDGAFVDDPGRVSIGAGLNTSIFGFWPGFGPFSRIRHKVSPSIGWSFSPAPETTDLQQDIFGLTNLREQNRLTLSFNQTFEAKYREADTTAAAPDTLVGQAGEPRRLPEVRKITLLSINTGTSFLYDFISAREEGRGFLTDAVSNSIRSDLLQGFQLSTTHDLFREARDAQLDPRGIPDIGLPQTPLAPRTFDPFLTRLTASFSIDQDFWLFRALGLSGGEIVPDTTAAGFPDTGAEGPAGSLDPDIGAEADPNRDPGGVGAIVNGRGADAGPIRGGLGGWQASLNYSLVRSRPELSRLGDNQMLTGNFSFRPTEHWTVRWSTGYSFTDGEFSDHMLTLSRDLHRWQANFDFVKAQNGNFAFSFRVNLIDNPDIKLDYDQRTDPNRSGLQGEGG